MSAFLQSTFLHQVNIEGHQKFNFVMFFMCFSGISNVVISHVFYLHAIWIS